MPVQPPTEDEIEQSLQTEISNQAPDITGWFPGSSVEASVDTFSGGLSTAYQYLVYTYFASTLKYAGATITADDCRAEGIDPATVNLPLINSLQSDGDLDAQAADHGVTRNPGAYARGEIVITYASSGESTAAGFEVTAPGVETDEPRSYVTTDIAQADTNSTTATVPIRAVGRGDEYDTGANTVEGIPENPGSVQHVTNPTAVTGGEGPESNPELRERARGAQLEDANLEQRLIRALNTPDEAGGVTERDIHLEEHRDGLPTRPETQGAAYGVAVIDYNGPVDSLVDSDGEPVADMQALVDAEKAFGIGVFFESPSVYTLDVAAEVAPEEPEQTTATSQDIDTTQAIQSAVEMLDELGLGDDFYVGQLQNAIRNADPDIAYIPPETFALSLTAPDGTTTTITGRQSISKREKVAPGTISVTAVPN